MALTLTINGREQVLVALAAGATLAEVVGALELKADRIAIERNGEIASRPDWGGVHLKDGDRLELVHFVGGG